MSGTQRLICMKATALQNVGLIDLRTLPLKTHDQLTRAVKRVSDHVASTGVTDPIVRVYISRRTLRWLRLEVFEHGGKDADNYAPGQIMGIDVDVADVNEFMPCPFCGESHL